MIRAHLQCIGKIWQIEAVQTAGFRMTKSKAEYHRDCIDQVVKALSMSVGAHHSESALRSKIGAQPDHVLLTAGIADFWLDLSQKEGSARRRASPPESPFRVNARPLVAQKKRIALWHDQWEAKRVAGEVLKAQRAAFTEEGRQAHAVLLEALLPWLVKRHTNELHLLGHAAWLPSSADPLLDQISGLDVRWLKLDAALAKPWIENGERRVWLSIRDGCQDIARSERERAELLSSTPAATETH